MTYTFNPSPQGVGTEASTSLWVQCQYGPQELVPAQALQLQSNSVLTHQREKGERREDPRIWTVDFHWNKMDKTYFKICCQPYQYRNMNKNNFQISLYLSQSSNDPRNSQQEVFEMTQRKRKHYLTYAGTVTGLDRHLGNQNGKFYKAKINSVIWPLLGICPYDMPKSTGICFACAMLLLFTVFMK